MAIAYEGGAASAYSALSDHTEITFTTTSPGGSVYFVAVGFGPGDAAEVTLIDADGETALFTRVASLGTGMDCQVELWQYHDPSGLLEGLSFPMTPYLDGPGWIAAVAIQLSGMKASSYAVEDSDTGTGTSTAPTVTSIGATANNWAVLAAAHNQANSSITGNNGTRRQEAHGASGGVAILTLGPNSAGSVSPSFNAVAMTKKWVAASAIVPAQAASGPFRGSLKMLGVGR